MQKALYCRKMSLYHKQLGLSKKQLETFAKFVVMVYVQEQLLASVHNMDNYNQQVRQRNNLLSNSPYVQTYELGNQRTLPLLANVNK